MTKETWEAGIWKFGTFRVLTIFLINWFAYKMSQKCEMLSVIIEYSVHNLIRRNKHKNVTLKKLEQVNVCHFCEWLMTCFFSSPIPFKLNPLVTSSHRVHINSIVLYSFLAQEGAQPRGQALHLGPHLQPWPQEMRVRRPPWRAARHRMERTNRPRPSSSPRSSHMSSKALSSRRELSRSLCV